MVTAQNENKSSKANANVSNCDWFIFYPPSIHDMQLKTKQTNEKIPPHKTDLKVASSHIIVVFPRRLWLTSPGNKQNYVRSLSIKHYKGCLALPFHFSEWRALFCEQLYKYFSMHTPNSLTDLDETLMTLYLSSSMGTTARNPAVTQDCSNSWSSQQNVKLRWQQSSNLQSRVGNWNS